MLLIGTSGAGKSTLARRLFRPTEIVSSDVCRGLVADDENDQTATPDAFALLHYLVGQRLRRGLLTVVDATNVQPEARKSLVALAREYHALPAAIILEVPEAVAAARNRARPERAHVGGHVIASQRQQLRRGLRHLKAEGFRHIHHLRSAAEIDAVTAVERTKIFSNRQEEQGPFDIIGDIHGCYDELLTLLAELGYAVETTPIVDERDLGVRVTPPPGRRVIFLGDLVDRGPASPAVLRLVMAMVEAGAALCVPGNHDMKLVRYLGGKEVQLRHGLAETVAQLAPEPAGFRERVRTFLDALTSHYVLDGGRLVVAHAGMRAEMQGRGSGAVRSFALYGETTGETDEFGLPVRFNWASEYRGRAMVVYGHTPVPTPDWLNHTIDIDTGCVFGGALTALRYPERELVSVPAARVYCEPVRPLFPAEPAAADPAAPAPTAQQQHDDLLDVGELLGKQLLANRYQPAVTIREENASAALETLSRFALDPRWLLYLPPTMSPSETSERPGLLEHPQEAFAYYARHGAGRVVCEEKHMGSRVVVVLARDEPAAARAFGLSDAGFGKCYTRTGRNFFTDAALETAFLDRLRDALTDAGFWDEFATDWVCLDAELLPWSAKAQSLIRDQYAAVAAAASAALPAAEAALAQAVANGLSAAAPLLAQVQARRDAATRYATAYRQYCWPVESVADLRLAPFHLLATAGRTYFDQTHTWQMQTLHRLCAAAPDLLRATPWREVDLADPTAVADATAWWEALTAAGGEGMVVKPLHFVARSPKNELLQPAIKCRGPEYLRIIYGPDYLLPANLARLRTRSLRGKRTLALREFALGLEGLDRFVAHAPLRDVHRCVFGVLALESEVVDPRL